MATLHIIIGLPICERSTEAKKIERRNNAVLLAFDVWHLKKTNNLLDDKQEKIVYSIESIIWDTAKRVLVLGTDVILDLDIYLKEERNYFKIKAKELGVKYKIHYIKITEKKLQKRIRKNILSLKNKDKYLNDKLEECIKIFEPPDDNELKNE